MNLIRVKVTAGAKKPLVVERSPSVLSVAVREPAEDNRANRAVIAAVAHFYAIPENKLRIISGHQKPAKLIRVLP